MVFHWSLSDKSLQLSRTLLAVLNNAVVWMVSTRSPTSKSSSPFNNPLVTVLKAPITIGIIVTFMFHSFFNSLARSKYLFFFSPPFSFIFWSAGDSKVDNFASSLFLLIIMKFGLLAEIIIIINIIIIIALFLFLLFYCLLSLTSNNSSSFYPHPILSPYCLPSFFCFFDSSSFFLFLFD